MRRRSPVGTSAVPAGLLSAFRSFRWSGVEVEDDRAWSALMARLRAWEYADAAPSEVAVLALWDIVWPLLCSRPDALWDPSRI